MVQECDAGKRNRAATELVTTTPWKREARFGISKPSPCGPQPGESHNAEGHDTDEVSTPYPQRKVVLSSPMTF